MARKTFEVAALRDRINTMLDPARCPDLTVGERRIAASILSGVLMDTDNYKGFRFLDVDYVTDDGGMIVESIIPDDSARRYY